MKKLLLQITWGAIFGFTSLSMFADNNFSSPVSVTNAVVYVPLGKSKNTTAFFSVKNNSKEVISITKVSSDYAKKINLVPVAPNAPANQNSSAIPNPWVILPGQSLTTKPDHQYLQLIDLKASITTGDELLLNVNLSNGKKLLVIAKAKSAYDQVHGY